MLISVTEAHAAAQHNPAVKPFDCRYDLTDPLAGQRAYASGHIPGAFYADLLQHLSGRLTGRNGRHPLPEPATLIGWLASLGVTSTDTIIAYDAADSLYAARLWWSCRWLGLNAWVLDGGLAAWQAAGLSLSSVIPTASANPALAQSISAQRAAWVSLAELDQALEDPATLLVDARAPERYRGEIEPLDAKAGHIPTAVNHFYKRHLTPTGHFLPKPQLAQSMADLLNGRAPDKLIASCGSGVTACHLLLVMAHLGLSGARLYPGSFSEWTQDPARPVRQGAEP